MIKLRHHLHQLPELGFYETQTSKTVAEKLKSWGYDVVEGIAGTGIVATLQQGTGKKILAIRADMDALPIVENTDLAYASKNDGVMHACGHDGHTTTLLTAARCISERKDFSGTVRLIFQPAEEGLGGAKKMIEEGLFTKFPCDAVFGYHNVPGIALGQFCFIPAIATAGSDRVRITIHGRSGHGAQPQKAIDPILIGSAIVSGLQSIISRNIAPNDAAVITVGSFIAGDAFNIIPETAELRLTVRSYDANIRALLETRIKELVQGYGAAYGATIDVEYRAVTPSVYNDEKLTQLAQKVAVKNFGPEKLFQQNEPFSFSEDFAYMLEQCPGCYLFIGNGNSANLHNDHYNFNDEIIEVGASFWVHLVEEFLQ
ncbi:M20 aminoacylase family protein [Bartonella sp. HY406]|uniref:M20 aminoacylase family protein n=1 Tax=Bartonella sp. HY406 TaxID=2979331 RepID=UPI0021C7DF52|nr:M20 aminoacylase family protein [Bartonella sp. HY406]UXN04810.1 M20 family metallopeptidase [Bartonella sp. HY406]